MTPLRPTPLFAGLLVAAVLAGCGPSGPRYHEVTGTVTLDKGKPLPDGAILFEHQPTADASYGPDYGLIKNGQFKLKVKEGLHKVRITADTDIPDQKDMYGNPLRKNYIQPKYNNDSTLTADVNAGSTTFTFEVEPVR